MNNAIDIATVSLDDTCKSILAKLKANGWSRAGVAYSTDVNTVSLSEFSYLLKNGGIVPQPSSGFTVKGVLRSYATPKFGPDVGSVAFELNFDLF